MLHKSIVACGIAGVALFSFAALPTIPLTPQMVGTVLRDKTIYTVSGTNTLDASLMPGVSALRVPIGAEAVIWMEKGSKLVVNGGPGYGIIGGGAGIEVPCGAKLVVDGEGELVATGGSAASGGAGYGGREGVASAYISPTNLPDGLLPCQRDKIAPVGMCGGIWSTNVFSTPLMYGRAGCGGEGGEGGGGAGAGIGGRGGWGGAGGAGGLTRCVVPEDVYAKDKQRYLDCETYFSMSNTIPFYVCDQESRFYLTGPMGTSGNSGLRGGSGGDVVILGKVKVAATAGGTVSLQGGGAVH